MSRTFDQVLSDVTAQSDPQRKTILNQIADLPNQQAAAESGLTAQKDQAYKDILSGAQQRGLGFSGIPLAEQAKYNATNYAPAVANLKTGYVNQQGTLENALSGIGSNDYSTANGIYNQDQQLALQQQQAAEQQRQFNANLDFQKQQAARQSASDSWMSDFIKQQQQQQQQPPAAAPDPYANIDKNGANNAVHSLLSTGNVGLVHDTINAITQSALRGNPYDKYKLELLNAAQSGNKNAAYNPTYAKLLQSAAAYKPAAPAPSIATQVRNRVTQAGPGNLSTGNLGNNLHNWFGWL